jgi:hypothetical protein
MLVKCEGVVCHVDGDESPEPTIQNIHPANGICCHGTPEWDRLPDRRGDLVLSILLPISVVTWFLGR